MASTDPLREALADAGEDFAVQVRSDSVEAAVDALRSAAGRADDLAIGAIAAPRISAVALLPDGPLMRFGDVPDRLDIRRRLATTLQDALTDAGIGDADVAVIPVDGLADLDSCRRAVVLRLFPPPAGAAARLDPSWIDIAAEWVFGDHRPDAPVRLRVLGVERTIRAADAAGVLHGCAASRAWCDVVTGDVTSRVRTASISFGTAPHVAIGAGGPDCDDDGLLARFDLLAEVARELAHECAYACIDFEDTFGDLGTGLSHTDWAVEGGASPNTIIGLLCDRYVPEAFGHQIIGPGHHEHLTRADPSRQWGSPIGSATPATRRELRIGEPLDWLRSSEVRHDVRGDAWELLAPVMLGLDDLDEVLQAADESGRASTPAPAPPQYVDPVHAAHGIPALESIVIDAETHPRRGTHLTTLELAGWLAGEVHGDEPVSVSPVLRIFVRHLGLGFDDARRQQIKPFAARLVGTNGSTDVERRRAWQLTDWLVRVHAPPWLRRAGLTESADRLDGLASITSDPDLVRAVELLGNAIVTASRRLEITTAIAGDRSTVVDQIAWDAWEEAAERTGWVAASEAALYAIPADLAYAADARVVECSRDPRIRAELEASALGLGDAIWSAALHEVATAAWQGAWAATEDFVFHESTFSIRTAMRRSLESELASTGDDLDADLLIDEADTAVRDRLSALVLDGAGTDFWSAAVHAASSGPGGKRWASALDETRRVLGAELFDEAIDVARAELHRWLDEAPRVVGRAVAASVAREASGVAGRGVAARAAAECLARGGSESDAEAAARATIVGIVDDLADDAVRMIGVLVDADADQSEIAAPG